ncbi:NnrU family protein [Aurantiacibacter poecillastricola]|uniref:NnrU family protein n=1 Tax=Aurantiacibacter poecillastricola TaxID=3064385 RepID=UPI00273FE47D|nr:NnrU family protein [Aurantiacibacter sp. 219JJ12-13]MDP5260638.1 NnrU family protein [Aurantiacibacter sp. 219JJ12-13]
MDPSLVSLIAAGTAFVGTHFALSHPLRAPLVGLVGERAFMGIYSVIALACLYWMGEAFKAAAPATLGGSGTVGWIAASVLTLLAVVLLFGSFRSNPALPAPGAEEVAANREPTGVFAVTRHPMMWSFALWALSHVALWWSWRTNIVALAILVLALLGAHLQDRKKEVLMGEAWKSWEARTSYWPRWGKLASVGWVLWLSAVVGWMALTWMHLAVAGIPAGAWRWF